MQYTNKHLVEVNCGFQFPEEHVSWDSTFFGQFYERIKNSGFDQKEERKGVQLTFKGDFTNPSTLPVTASAIEDQVIFRNTTKNYAIILGKGKISFHIVNSYPGWDAFLSDLIKPFFNIYNQLGLGNGLRQCTIVYLNKFTKASDVDLSDYFTIVSHVEPGFGSEITTSVQRMIANDKLLLIAKMHSQLDGHHKTIHLECGAVSTNEESMKSTDWLAHANETHEPIPTFFEAIVTDQLKKEL